MIRQWVESRFVSIREGLDKSGRMTGISSLLRNRWIEILYLVGMIVMSAGIVPALVEPVSIQYIIYPGSDSQSVSETFINSMALLMGFGGFYLSYLSGRQTVKPRLVGFYLVLGLLLIATAIFLEMYVYLSK